VQEAWEANIPLQMGQWLSIPFVLLGIYLIIQAKKRGEPRLKEKGKRKKEKGKI